MNARIKSAVAVLGAAASVVTIVVGLYAFFGTDAPPATDRRDQDVQVHSGSGDNIQADGDVHIYEGVPQSLVEQWRRAEAHQTAQLVQLQRDFLALRGDIRTRSTREAEMLRVLDDMDRGDIRAAESRLIQLFDREVRINLFAAAGETADMIGRLKALRLDRDGAEAYARRSKKLRDRASEDAGPATSAPDEATSPASRPPPSTRAQPPAESRADGGGPRVFRDALDDGGYGPEMVRLKGGRFLMGSPEDEPQRRDDEGPQHWVIVKPFAIGRTEVSFADYDRFATATGREKPSDLGWGRGEWPAINVSWEVARAYAAWLSEQTGQRYRLPTEAEWEYAARAGTHTPFWTGDCIHTDQANYNGNYDDNDCGAKTGVSRGQTVPTGSLPANPFGLHEVVGNVWEWVQDCWHTSYEGAPSDGSAWESSDGGDCGRRVVRGGSWNYRPEFLRSASRHRPVPGPRFNFLGFRLAQDP